MIAKNNVQRCPACDLEDDECLCDASAVDLRQVKRERDAALATVARLEARLEKYKGTGEVLAPSCGCQPGETLWKCSHLVPHAAPPTGTTETE